MKFRVAALPSARIMRSESDLNAALAASDAWKKAVEIIEQASALSIKAIQKFSVVMNMETSAMRNFYHIREMYGKNGGMAKEITQLQETIRSISSVISEDAMAQAVVAKTLDLKPVVIEGKVVKLTDITEMLNKTISSFQIIFQTDTAPRISTKIEVSRGEPGKETLKRPEYKEVLEKAMEMVKASVDLMDSDYLTAVNMIKELNEFLQSVLAYGDIKKEGEKEAAKQKIQQHPLYSEFEPYVKWQSPEGKTQFKISDEFVQASVKKAASILASLGRAIVADVANKRPQQIIEHVTLHLSNMSLIFSDGLASMTASLGGTSDISIPDSSEDFPELRAAASDRSAAAAAKPTSFKELSVWKLVPGSGPETLFSKISSEDWSDFVSKNGLEFKDDGFSFGSASGYYKDGDGVVYLYDQAVTSDPDEKMTVSSSAKGSFFSLGSSVIASYLPETKQFNVSASRKQLTPRVVAAINTFASRLNLLLNFSVNDSGIVFKNNSGSFSTSGNKLARASVISEGITVTAVLVSDDCSQLHS